MEIVMKKVSELKPYDKNTKKHDAKQVENVANSIKRFGWQQPIVIDDNGVVVIGHCRLMAAKKLGLSCVPVTVASGLTDLEIRELRIADNKTNESAWDLGLFYEDAEGLLFEGFDIGLGLEEFEKDNEVFLSPACQDDDEEKEIDEYAPAPYDKSIVDQYKDHEAEFLAKKRIIITYSPEREPELAELLGLSGESLKIVYDLSELVD